MKLKYLYFFITGLIFLSSFSVLQEKQLSNSITLLSKTKQVTAGTTILLKFSSEKEVEPLLYCTNSYGSVVIKPSLQKKILSYEIPEMMSNKSGIVNWRLVNKSSLSGSFTVLPVQKTSAIETYIGPPSIEAGGKDFSMLVVIPTDSLDNPLPEHTAINSKHQFLASEEKEVIYTKNLIAFHKLFSPLKNGRMLVSSECLGKNSKEFTVNIQPTNPTDFKILAESNHLYADGNQITTFYTSVLKDQFDNIVSDGTFVTFVIKNKDGAILKTSGTTIKGIATGKIIHPDYETTWNISAHVHGMAKSNEIILTYKQALKNIDVEFSKNNRTITVGPLQSFMQQMIPDGLEVKLIASKNNSIINSETKTSYNGYVTFMLNTATYPKEKYTITISSSGLKKEFKLIDVW